MLDKKTNEKTNTSSVGASMIVVINPGLNEAVTPCLMVREVGIGQRSVEGAQDSRHMASPCELFGMKKVHS